MQLNLILTSAAKHFILNILTNATKYSTVNILTNKPKLKFNHNVLFKKKKQD